MNKQCSPIVIPVEVSTDLIEIPVQVSSDAMEFEVDPSAKIEVMKEETGNYEKLYNKPKINGVILSGDISFEELGEETLTNLEIATIFNKVFGGS